MYIRKVLETFRLLELLVLSLHLDVLGGSMAVDPYTSPVVVCMLVAVAAGCLSLLIPCFLYPTSRIHQHIHILCFLC